MQSMIETCGTFEAGEVLAEPARKPSRVERLVYLAIWLGLCVAAAAALMGGDRPVGGGLFCAAVAAFLLGVGSR